MRGAVAAALAAGTLGLLAPAVADAGVLAFTSDRCESAADHDQRGQQAPNPVAPPGYRSPRCRRAIWAVNDDGTNLRRVSSSGSTPYADDSFPAWSPEGTRILFLRSGSPEETGIWLLDAAGTERKVGSAENSPFFSGPRWIPGGARIVYESNRPPVGHPGDCPRSHIFTSNVDGSDEAQLTDAPFEDRTPDPSPDGRKIAFVRYSGSICTGNPTLQGTVYTMNPDGSGLTALTAGDLPILFTGLRFSPDGRFIALTIGAGLYTMTADGAQVRRVAAYGAGPAWSPTGPTLYYGENSPVSSADGEAHNRLMKLDLSRQDAEPVPVTDGAASDSNPDWHPLGVAPLRPIADLLPPGVVLIGQLPGLPQPPQPSQGKPDPADQLRFLAIDRSGIRRIQAAIARRSGRRCRFFDGRRFGLRRSCKRWPYRTVTSPAGWRARTHRLPAGRYDLRFRMTDVRGNVARNPRVLHVRVRR